MNLNIASDLMCVSVLVCMCMFVCNDEIQQFLTTHKCVRKHYRRFTQRVCCILFLSYRKHNIRAHEALCIMYRIVSRCISGLGAALFLFISASGKSLVTIERRCHRNVLSAFFASFSLNLIFKLLNLLRSCFAQNGLAYFIRLLLLTY